MFNMYGQLMDLRILDEIDFWKQQEAEHTVVIEQLVPDLEPQFVNALKDWQAALAATQALAVQYTEALGRSGGMATPAMHAQIMQLTQFSIQQTLQFIQLLNQLQAYSIPVRKNPVVNVVINHIRRESEYFIGALRGIGHY